MEKKLKVPSSIKSALFGAFVMLSVCSLCLNYGLLSRQIVKPEWLSQQLLPISLNDLPELKK